MIDLYFNDCKRFVFYEIKRKYYEQFNIPVTDFATSNTYLPLKPLDTFSASVCNWIRIPIAPRGLSTGPGAVLPQ